VDVRTDGRTDTPEFQSTRSSVGDDLKIGLDRLQNRSHPMTTSFELRAKVAEEIDVEMCSYGQSSEVQMVRDLVLDLGWGQGHISIHSTCITSSVPNRVTVASCTTEI